MNKTTGISWLFYVGFLYDAVLGAAFLWFGSRLFDWYQVPPPNHPGYIQFPAGLLLVFALMFLAVARNPLANRNLIPYGILLKVCYCAVVFGHWLTAGIPGMWKPWAILDLAFALLFLWAYFALGRLPSAGTSAASASGG
jgi:hypothetical protein